MLILCNNVTFYRKLRNLTESDLASLTGTTRRTISCIECGKHNPSLKLGMLISVALDIEINKLFYFEDINVNEFKKDIGNLI